MDVGSESLANISVASTHAEFDDVFRAHYSRIARVIRRIVEDPGRAEELAADVFWKYLQHRRAHDESPAGWLYRTAVRKGLDELRSRRRREKYKPLLTLLGIAPSPEQLLAASQDQQQVRSVLSVLKHRDTALLILRSEGLSYQEIAGVLQLNETSIGTLVRRAQEAFRKEYVNRYGPQTY